MRSRAVAQLASLTFALSVLGVLVLRASGCMSSPPVPATAESPQSAPAASVVAAPTESVEVAPAPAPSETAPAPSATAVNPKANSPTPAGPKPRFMPATKAGPIFDPQPQAPAQQQQQLNPPP